MILPEYGLFNENLSTGYGIAPFELLVREVPQAPKTTQATAIALG